MEGTNSQLWYLEKVDLHEFLCPNKFANFEGEHKFHRYKKGEYIYLQEEPARFIYLVAKGKVKIGEMTADSHEAVKSILGSGDIFGELAMVGEQNRSDFAQAMENDTTLCAMTVADMENLMLDNKTLSLKLYKIMGFRIKKLEQKVSSLVFKDARTRIIEFVAGMGMEKGVKVGQETMIKSNLTHKDIAQLTGTSRQTVTTVLNDLKADNLINFNRRQILIRDLKTFVPQATS